jgi:hypothetical protein
VDFAALEELRTKVIELRSAHVPTMLTYLNNKKNGFFHQKSQTDKTSLASSATCFNSLVMANALEAFITATDGAFHSTELLVQIYTKDNSSGLSRNNPFSTSFICELAQQIIKTDDNYKGLEAAKQRDISNALNLKLEILFKLILRRMTILRKMEKTTQYCHRSS